MKKILLSLPILLLTIGVVGCKDDDDNPCGLKGEREGEIENFVARMFVDIHPDETYEDPYIYYTDGSAVLIMGQGVKSYGLICNFPSYALAWNVPAEGIDVEIEGIRYKYLGFYPTDRIMYDLVLTSLKRK